MIAPSRVVASLAAAASLLAAMPAGAGETIRVSRFARDVAGITEGRLDVAVRPSRSDPTRATVRVGGYLRVTEPDTLELYVDVPVRRPRDKRCNEISIECAGVGVDDSRQLSVELRPEKTARWGRTMHLRSISWRPIRELIVSSDLGESGRAVFRSLVVRLPAARG